MDPNYERWLIANYERATVSTQLSQARRLEQAYGDLDQLFDRDQFKSVLKDLEYTPADRKAGKPNQSRVQIKGEQVYEGLAHLRSALGFYTRFRSSGKETEREPIDLRQLEEMRVAFLKRCGDFSDFQTPSGFYHEQERSYKDALLKRAAVILAIQTDPESDGQKFLELLQTKPSNFVGWRTFAELSNREESQRRQVAIAIGELVRSSHAAAEACALAAERIAPHLLTARGTPDFGAIRSLVTAVLALAKPNEAICVKTAFMQKAALRLTHARVFGQNVLTAVEYGKFLQLANLIRAELERWDWKPRDLWDVQGFLWVVTNYGDSDPAGPVIGTDGEDELVADVFSHPLNSILYGPPGTGKTWNTVRLAVEICLGHSPQSRSELMNLYNDLVRARRVAFTTFHQSIGYEEFVEGLRPVTDSDDEVSSAGFRLEPHSGVLREICALAEQARKRGGRSGKFDFTGRRFFKMSLGRARTETHIYDAAIAGNYVVLGWGGDVDWSDNKYTDYKSVYDRWQSIEPGTSGNSGNISQIWTFRAMKKGDLVIVSDGNLRFRAIGEIVGDYRFTPSEDGNHRRSVRWLAVLDESLPIETIYRSRLSQASCYELSSKKMNLDALAEQITTEPSSGTSRPEPFVLIIDEINRANVSKVFGELITLLEPDKRLGEPNALTVKLPYSGADFGVPNNLYVIGTMNTADRSIALLDTALRRRFTFIEMMPEYGLLDGEVDGINLRRLLFSINRRIEWLFDREHQLGHSFFMNIATKAALDEVMRRKVIPLLTEYFYEDWEKVRAALNDTGGWFLTVEPLSPPLMMKDSGEQRLRYTVRAAEIPHEGYVAAIGAL